MPQASVIIPNHNHASFPEERIQSVLKQGFTDFEMIILDDGSTDNDGTSYRFKNSAAFKNYYFHTNKLGNKKN